MKNANQRFGFAKSLLAMAMLLALSGGCAVDEEGSTPGDEAVTSTESALIATSTHTVYYSDATFTTVVGHEAILCDGHHTQSGIRTDFYEDTDVSCSRRPPVEVTKTCYSWGQWGPVEVSCPQ